MARIRSTAALLALGFITSACSTMYDQTYRDQNLFIPNRSVYSINQPVVHRTDYVFEANTGGNGIAAGEMDRLNAWFQSLQLRYGDRVSLDGDYADPSARADVADLAASYGLLLSNEVPLTAGPVRPGTVRVIVSRAAAIVPGCPNWSDRNAVGQPVSSNSSNYGCAVNSNLAAMIADPRDLVLGQTGSGTGDATAAAKAVRVYREAEPTGKGGLDEVSSKGN